VHYPHWYHTNYRGGFENGRPDEFHPDYECPNSNIGFNNNRYSSGDVDKQNSGIYDGQSDAGGFINSDSGGLNNQGILNNRPDSFSNSNSRADQGDGESTTQSSNGSSSQGSKGSSSQDTEGSNNQRGQVVNTIQRPPLNIILNENTMINSTVRECIQSKCPSTNEYNPICGNDDITYQNPSKFKCSQLCQSGKYKYTGVNRISWR